jgi:hypothetical protein
MDAPAPAANPRHETRASLYATTAALALVAALGWPNGSANHGANQGQDTICQDFVRMAHEDQRAVMDRAGISSAVAEARIIYFVAQCRADPHNSGRPIGGLW